MQAAADQQTREKEALDSEAKVRSPSLALSCSLARFFPPSLSLSRCLTLSLVSRPLALSLALTPWHKICLANIYVFSRAAAETVPVAPYLAERT